MVAVATGTEHHTILEDRLYLAKVMLAERVVINAELVAVAQVVLVITVALMA